jgi:superfamily II DNA or RNA helicase
MFSSVNKTYKNGGLKLRPVQMQGIGRLVNDGVGILAHDVGYGKTLQGILATAEMVHRGWAKKPLIVVPSENVYRQWIDDMQRVIPGVTINQLGNLGASFKGDLSSLKIEDKSFSIVTYEGLQRLSFRDETYAEMASKFKYIADDLTAHKTERQKQKDKKGAEEIGGTMKKGTRSDIFFEDLGFDLLTFDEIHNANHIVSKVKLEKGKASEFNQFGLTPSDLGIKTWLAAQYIQEKQGGRNVFGLSATPFTNHPLEYYSILSLIAQKSLERMGADNVNNFFGTFMEAESRDEFKADGKYAKKTDIRRFRNFRQFRKLLSTYIDFREGEAEGIIRPNRLQRNYEIPASEKQNELMQLAQAMFNDKANAGTLRAIGELRKVAFSPSASTHGAVLPVSAYKEFVDGSPKIKTTMELIAQNKKDKSEAGQIVYTEVGVSFLPHMKEYLVKEVGYKDEEVAIISGATPKPKRGGIQDDFNAGKIKVLLGSEAIKEGMNLQENTCDIYVLSLPWNFTQLRQVIGRAWRHGNKWKNVRINNMFIQNSVDVFMSQKLENKQSRYESTIASGENEVDVGDIDFDEMKFDLVTDPELRANLQLQGRSEKLEQEIVQAKAELAFSTRKLDKIAEIDKKLEAAQDAYNREKASVDSGKETDTFWLDRHAKEIKDFKKTKAEETAKLAEKGIDTTSLLTQMEKGKAEIVALEEKKKTLSDSKDALLAEIKSTLPVRQRYSDDVVAKFRADRAEDNKTFYMLRGEEKTEVVAIEEKVHEIKNGKGDVVKKKTTTAVKKTEKVKEVVKQKSNTKDNAMLKSSPILSCRSKKRYQHCSTRSRRVRASRMPESVWLAQRKRTPLFRRLSRTETAQYSAHWRTSSATIPCLHSSVSRRSPRTWKSPLLRENAQRRPLRSLRTTRSIYSTAWLAYRRPSAGKGNTASILMWKTPKWRTSSLHTPMHFAH